MKIVVDAMGGDYAPGAIIEGVADALRTYADVNVVLVGRESAIRNELAKFEYPKERVEIVHADEVVEMNEPAVTSIRQKRKSSISLGVQLLKDQQYDAFISAGNTGAVVAASTIFLRMLPGAERPGIGLVIPTLKGFSFLIDVGATTAPKPDHLMHFALMAKVYAQEILDIKDPKIGLLNIGEEEGKGTGFMKDAHKKMQERFSNFIGNVEATEIFSGRADCIVADGYVGNVVIKVSEAVMESTAALIKREIRKSPIALLGAFLMRSKLREIKRHADYSEYGGAPLLGVNGLVMISHGRSSPKAIKNAIRATRREIKHNILSIMRREISV